MTNIWNLIKYPGLTFAVVVEYFVITLFSSTPVEHAVLMWLVTAIAFGTWDEVLKVQKKDS